LEAVETLQRGLALEPDLAAAHHYLGVALGAMGKWEEARQAFAAALKNNPSDPEIHYNFGVALKYHGDWRGAVQEFTSAIELRPGHPQARCSLAEGLFQIGENDRANSVLLQAREFGSCEPGRPR